MRLVVETINSHKDLWFGGKSLQKFDGQFIGGVVVNIVIVEFYTPDFRTIVNKSLERIELFAQRLIIFRIIFVHGDKKFFIFVDLNF